MEVDVVKNLKKVEQEVANAVNDRVFNKVSSTCSIIAISTGQPIRSIVALYEAGQKHFAEVELDELFEKANDRMLLESCPKICWHFIGDLEHVELEKLVKVPNLFLVQCVDNLESAKALDEAWGTFKRSDKKHKFSTLRIMLPVYVIGEKICTEAAQELIPPVVHECQNLILFGYQGRFLFKDDTDDIKENAICKNLIRFYGFKNSSCKRFKIKDECLKLCFENFIGHTLAVIHQSDLVYVGDEIFGDGNKSTSEQEGNSTKETSEESANETVEKIMEVTVDETVAENPDTK